MQLKINNAADEFAISQVAGLQNYKSIAALVAAYADVYSNSNGNNDEEFEIIIAKELLPDSYKNNATALALKILSKINDSHWKDASGYATPTQESTHVTIKILRDRKPDNARRTNAKPSIKAIIKEWLALNKPKSIRLTLKVRDVPPFYLSHSEQLTYQIKRETSKKIKILRLDKTWIISRK